LGPQAGKFCFLHEEKDDVRMNGNSKCYYNDAYGWIWIKAHAREKPQVQYIIASSEGAVNVIPFIKIEDIPFLQLPHFCDRPSLPAA